MSDENQYKQSRANTEPRKATKIKRKPRIGLYIKTVSWHRLHKKMMTVLAREIDYLMAKSYKQELTDKQSLKLVNYLKLEEKLLKFEDGLDENISDEELAKITSKSIRTRS